MDKRKVIQIAVLQADGYRVLYAVCNDGTVWDRYESVDGEWTPEWGAVEDVPQPEAPCPA